MISQPQQERQFPALEADDVGAVLCEEPRPLCTFRSRDALRVHGVHGRLAINDETIPVHLTFWYRNADGAIYAVPHARHRNWGDQIGKRADHCDVVCGVGIHEHERRCVESIAVFIAPPVVVRIDDGEAPRFGDAGASIVR